MRRTLLKLRGLKTTKGVSAQYDEGQSTKIKNLWDFFKTVALHKCDHKEIVYVRYLTVHYVGYMCKGCATEWLAGRSSIKNSTHPWAEKLLPVGEDNPFELGRLLERGTYFKEIDR